MKNQEAGNTLFSLTDNIQVLLLGGDEKKAHPIHQNPSMTASTYVKPKVVFSWGEKKKRGSRKIKTKTPSQTYSNLHIHTLSHRDALVPIYPSKPPSTHLNTRLITTAGTEAPALTDARSLTHIPVSGPWAVRLSLHFSHDTMMLRQPEVREMFIQSPRSKV